MPDDEKRSTDSDENETLEDLEPSEGESTEVKGGIASLANAG